MSTYKIDDIVVFLPGILGSVLAKNGKEVWGVSASAIWNALRSGGDSIKELAIEATDDPSLDDLGDGVVATRMVADAHLVPGLWKIDDYTKLMENITRTFRLVRGKSAFEFPYDWRRDLRVSSRKLARSIAGWLGEWRKQRPDARVVLIAHSMGGLVARHYLEVLGGWSDVRTLITIGTPHGGSLNALNFIVNGRRPGVGPVELDLSPLLRSFTSIYQLLPTYESVSLEDGELRMIQDVPGLPHVDYGRVASALAFHDQIAAHVRDRPATVQARIVPVVGIEQPTLQSARFAGGKLEVLETRNGKDEGGDGTVPRISAVPFELLEADREVYAAELHGSLQNHSAILNHLHGVLSSPSIDISRTRLPDIRLSLALPDVFAAEEPVEMFVRPSDGQPELNATLMTADGVPVDHIQLQPQLDGTQRAVFDPVSEGIYRVRIDGEVRVSPITDLFAVAGA